ncbi:sigma-54-dependent Fis family transcriptional regulator [Aquabacterium sp. A7-Y]|uniref:sigma-54-dependent Fis family transcriptional regulator n=1 Tax=Aquabacterium sp. A7-Y TaxID=1349605 RepID=UPI00223CE287|nr:sigma-54-dependent Fis family transcriptional regulator [Aquabacterium sp. A7-Y]MCW7541360.1 sigma-54-dependent Fis family transcriptional regulator [Aquabacterium sp. A7-Y]
MQHLSGLERARLALEGGGRLPAGALGQTLAASWKRCLDHGLDPLGRAQVAVVEGGDLKGRRERDALLRRLAIAEMQVLYEQISGSNFMIAFADRDGVILDTISDPGFAQSRDGQAIVPGSWWREQERGTNALGLALLERAPIAVYGREHFFAAHGHLSCMAAPVFNAGGEVIGLLDASCSNEARQQHTHALVRMAAAQIENGLIYRERSDVVILAFHPRMEYLDTLSAGLLSLAPDGRLGALNRVGRALLAGLDAQVGRRFDELFDVKLDRALDSVLGGAVLRVRDRAGSAVFMVCRQIGNRAAGGRGSPAPAAVQVPPRPSTASVGFVCEDPVLQRRMTGIAEAARRRMPVHLLGETGTGKELMARHVHALSGRSGAFVAVNCGAIAESLFIAELFGHERGAYTNARQDGSPGLIQAADQGTLFLDEVADIPASAQTTLLRFLDAMEVRPVGGQKVKRVDVQIVSAANRDLREAVAAGRFRADLYYRLNGYEVLLPPLRERADFGLLVHHLLEAIQPGIAITDEAIERLRRRPWPGNMRELRTTLQRAVIAAEGGFLDEDGIVSDGAQAPAACPECRGHALARRNCLQIRETCASVGGNIAEAARLLGISRTTVYKHLRDN